MMSPIDPLPECGQRVAVWFLSFPWAGRGSYLTWVKTTEILIGVLE